MNALNSLYFVLFDLPSFRHCVHKRRPHALPRSSPTSAAACTCLLPQVGALITVRSVLFIALRYLHGAELLPKAPAGFIPAAG